LKVLLQVTAGLISIGSMVYISVSHFDLILPASFVAFYLIFLNVFGFRKTQTLVVDQAPDLLAGQRLELFEDASRVLEEWATFSSEVIPSEKFKDSGTNEKNHSPEEALRAGIEQTRRVLGSASLQNLRRGINAASNFYESYHKLPYLRRFIINTIEKSETATMEVLEKFSILKDEIDNSAMEAKSFMEELTGMKGGVSFHEMILDVKKITDTFEAQFKNFDHFNKSVGVKFQDISKGVEEIEGMLGNIVEISEQNNVISINSSIEASKLGRQGAGFKVLVGEILKSNEKTQQFIQEINRIILGLKESNTAITGVWNTESRIFNVAMKKSMETTEGIITAFSESYQNTTGVFLGLEGAMARMRDHMNRVLTSLQFQDITRQQLENVMQFILDIEASIRSGEAFFQSQGKDIHKIDPEVLKKIRSEFLKKAKVMDEKLILEEMQLI